MHVDEDMVRRLCDLARLSLPGEALGPMAGELERIFNHMGRLAQVPTEALGQGGVGPNVLRDDRPEPSLDRAALLALAPQTDGRYFLVPSVVEGEA